MTIPIVISATIDTGGQLESGDTIEAFAKNLAGERLHALGLNCALSASDLAPHIERLAASTPARLWLYPNAGYPDDAGRYREPVGVIAGALGKIAGRGLVSAVGGCCGTTPAHIAAIAKAVNDLRPRAAPRPPSIPR